MLSLLSLPMPRTSNSYFLFICLFSFIQSSKLASHVYSAVNLIIRPDERGRIKEFWPTEEQEQTNQPLLVYRQFDTFSTIKILSRFELDSQAIRCYVQWDQRGKAQTFQHFKCYTSFISFNNYSFLIWPHFYSVCLRNQIVTVLKKLKMSFFLTDFFFVLSWQRKG